MASTVDCPLLWTAGGNEFITKHFMNQTHFRLAAFLVPHRILRL